MTVPKQKVDYAQQARTFLQNSINTLVANIRFAAAEEDSLKTIAITSSLPNEGKSTIAIKLAEGLAATGKSVLLMEGDMHNRSIAKMLGVKSTKGVYGVLLGREGLHEAVQLVCGGRLNFLDCEPHIPNPANVFASARFAQLIKRLKKEYDYVVIDTPPLTQFVDGAVVGSRVDATLLVVRQNYVKREDLRYSMEQLRKADANVIGTVMNYCESERREYYYDYYKNDTSLVNPNEVSERESVFLDMKQVDAVSSLQQKRAAATTTATRATSTVQPVQPAQGGTVKPIPPDSTAQFMTAAGYTQINPPKK